MKQSAIIYERKGKIFVRTSSLTTTGAWIETGPCTSLEIDTIPSALGDAVLEHLQQSSTGLAHPTDWKSLSEPLLRAAAVRSWNTFGKSARSVNVTSEAGIITIQPTVNNLPGFMVIEDDVRTLDAGAAAGALGEMVRAALAASR